MLMGGKFFLDIFNKPKMKKMYLDVVHIYIFVFFKLDEWLQSYDLKCINMYNLDGGVHWQIFWVFQLFQIISHQCGWKWPTMANLAKKVA